MNEDDLLLNNGDFPLSLVFGEVNSQKKCFLSVPNLGLLRAHKTIWSETGP